MTEHVKHVEGSAGVVETDELGGSGGTIDIEGNGFQVGLHFYPHGVETDARIVHVGSVGGDVSGFPLEEKSVHGLSCRGLPAGGPTLRFSEDDGGFIANDDAAEGGHFQRRGEMPGSRGGLLIAPIPPSGERKHEDGGKEDAEGSGRRPEVRRFGGRIFGGSEVRGFGGRKGEGSRGQSAERRGRRVGGGRGNYEG